ncbi:MAG: patatin-like phospholipase family protein [Bacteroidia bacterium]
MKEIIYKSALVVMCALSFQNVFPQQNNKCPKIGLTLSGGGAKGLAHIGILQAIDSAGLKIDYITGTSMGSVVGGLYAAGYSADTIETIARTLDWDLLFSTSPQIGAISIEEKDEFNKYALEIPFQHGKFKIGKGIIEGQELWLKFAELFQPVYNITDFNKLPIPYACIGTDLATGNAVVMDRGNIITCIRASMAIPAVFTPVQYEDKTLVDGGIVNNFPVLDAKSMGADIIIGVNLNKGLNKAEDLKTTLDILMQMAFFKDAADFEKHRKQCDIYIAPDLQGNSAGSFDNGDSIIDIGKKCGQLYYPIFKHLADSLNALYPDKKPFVKNRLPVIKTMSIDKYTVTGLDRTTEKFFFGLSGLHSGKTYSYKREAESIRAIYGSRYFKSIKYDCIPLDSGKTEMRFKVEENPLTAVKFALNYNTFTDLSLILNITSRDLLFKESRAVATVSVSENPRLNLEYYKYLGSNRKYGLNLAFFDEHIDFPVYDDFKLYETLRSKYFLFDARVQYNINLNMYIGLSQQYNNSRLKTIGSPATTFDGTNTFWNSYLSFIYNSIDKKYFTTKGWKVRASAGYVYNQSPDFTVVNDGVEVNNDSLGYNYGNYVRLLVKADHFTPLNTKFVFTQNVSLAYMITDNPYLPNSFQVGGISENLLNQVTFAGLSESEVKTGSIASGQLGLQYKLAKTAYLTGRVNVGLYDFHNVAMSDISLNNNFLSGYGLTFGLMSPIGPIELTAMYCDQDGKVRSNLNLGFKF